MRRRKVIHVSYVLFIYSWGLKNHLEVLSKIRDTKVNGKNSQNIMNEIIWWEREKKRESRTILI